VIPVKKMNTKEQLIKHCQDYIASHIATLRTSLNEIQKAANEETKSSMGDKFETGRSMLHLERDKIESQLNEYLILERTIYSIPEKRSDKIDFGSLVHTTTGIFYIAMGLGKQLVNNVEYLIIGPSSPIAKELGKRAINDSLIFNGQSIKIISIE